MATTTRDGLDRRRFLAVRSAAAALPVTGPARWRLASPDPAGGYPFTLGVAVLIETTQSSKHKYEYDHQRGVMSLDRRMYSAVSFPANCHFRARKEKKPQRAMVGPTLNSKARIASRGSSARAG